ncbi:MAG: transporter substrate-binding domain-containing protein [Deltaproteobacteria bacterium]|nr:transporter substrate-binding domain-containing protein [Deltaproteobacteria bacterium]
MNKKLIWLFTALIYLIFASPLTAQTAFRMVYFNKENPPRILGNGTSIDWSKPGITVELFKMVAESVGMQFEFKRMPWKRCLYAMQHGLADATFHASFKPARAEFGVYPTRDGQLDPSRCIYKNSYVFYARKGSGVKWNGNTISNASRPIGTQLSYAIADDLRKMGYEIEEEASVANNLNKLKAGRISAYAEIESIADYALGKERTQYENIVKLQPPLREKVYYLLIAKSFVEKNRRLAEQIWDAVRDVQQTDAYREMLRKYME